jgi:hypothetical protein
MTGAPACAHKAGGIFRKAEIVIVQGESRINTTVAPQQLWANKKE